MASAPRIVIQDDKGLTAADRLSLAALSGAVHPPGSPPNPVTAGLEWADATLRAMAWQDGRMVCHVGALLRAATMDGRAVKIGGVGEVMTAPDARRLGYAKAALEAMCRHLIEVQQVSFLMLFCAPALRGFYARLGWRPFAGKLLIGQRGSSMEFPLDAPMVHDGRPDRAARGYPGSERASLVTASHRQGGAFESQKPGAAYQTSTLSAGGPPRCRDRTGTGSPLSSRSAC